MGSRSGSPIVCDPSWSGVLPLLQCVLSTECLVFRFVLGDLRRLRQQSSLRC